MTQIQVLITGASGAVGSAIVPEYLRDGDAILHLPLRARDDQHFERRIQSLHEFWSDTGVPALPAERIRFYRADLELPNLGLAEPDLLALTNSITHIVHSAASVRLNLDLERAKRACLDTSLGVLDLATRAFERGQLRKFDYVSTVGVAGSTPGLIPELPLPGVTRFRNTYEAAKAEAEKHMLAAAETGLPLTIHRPSMVVGDSRTGKIIHFQVFYFLAELLAGRLTRGFVPKAAHFRLDIIPSDFVAKAIVWASRTPDLSTGRILHLCSGPEYSIPLEQLTEAALAAFAAHGGRHRAIRKVRPGTLGFLMPLLQLAAPQHYRKWLKNVGAFLEYLKDAEQSQRFGNSDTLALLSESGIALPDPKDYLPAVLRYYALRNHPA